VAADVIVANLAQFSRGKWNFKVELEADLDLELKAVDVALMNPIVPVWKGCFQPVRTVVWSRPTATFRQEKTTWEVSTRVNGGMSLILH